MTQAGKVCCAQRGCADFQSEVRQRKQSRPLKIIHPQGGVGRVQPDRRGERQKTTRAGANRAGVSPPPATGQGGKCRATRRTPEDDGSTPHFRLVDPATPPRRPVLPRSRVAFICKIRGLIFRLFPSGSLRCGLDSGGRRGGGGGVNRGAVSRSARLASGSASQSGRARSGRSAARRSGSASRL